MPIDVNAPVTRLFYDAEATGALRRAPTGTSAAVAADDSVSSWLPDDETFAAYPLTYYNSANGVEQATVFQDARDGRRGLMTRGIVNPATTFPSLRCPSNMSTTNQINNTTWAFVFSTMVTPTSWRWPAGPHGQRHRSRTIVWRGYHRPVAWRCSDRRPTYP